MYMLLLKHVDSYPLLITAPAPAPAGTDRLAVVVSTATKSRDVSRSWSPTHQQRWPPFYSSESHVRWALTALALPLSVGFTWTVGNRLVLMCLWCAWRLRRTIHCRFDLEKLFLVNDTLGSDKWRPRVGPLDRPPQG